MQSKTTGRLSIELRNYETFLILVVVGFPYSSLVTSTSQNGPYPAKHIEHIQYDKQGRMTEHLRGRIQQTCGEGRREKTNPQTMPL